MKIFTYLGIFLSHPATIFFTTAIFGYFLFSDFRRYLKKTRNLPEWVCLMVGIFNGALSVAAEMLTNNDASPRTIALFIPVILFLELMIFGVPGIWGGISIFSIFTFAASTVFSTCVALVNISPGETLSGLRIEKVIPVTLTTIIIIFLLVERRIDNGNRLPWDNVKNVLHDKNYSLFMVIYMILCSLIVSYVSTRNMVYIYDPGISKEFRQNITVNMYSKDVLIFILGIILFVFQVYKYSIDVEKNELESDLVVEKGYRESAQRKAFLRIGYNMMTKKIIKGEEFFDKWVEEGQALEPDKLMSIFTQNCVHEEHRHLLEIYGSKERAEILLANNSVVDNPILISSKAIKEYGVLDEKGLDVFKDEDKEWRWINFHGVFVRNENNEIIQYLELSDIDEQMLKSKNIEKLATIDYLTGLYNRSEFEKRLGAYLENDDAKGALFMVDLDNFKLVNDNMGHLKGDVVLIETSYIFKEFFRGDDLICRIGGDEFCIFLKRFDNKDMLRERAAKLNESGRRTYLTQKGDAINISFSVGIAMIPQDAHTYNELYHKADEALYHSKRTGRDCSTFYSDL